MEGYAYRLTRVGGGSDKYGVCEVCKKQVDTTYYLTQFKRYTRPDGTVSMTQHGCFALFGHKDCLSKKTEEGIIMTQFTNPVFAIYEGQGDDDLQKILLEVQNQFCEAENKGLAPITPSQFMTKVDSGEKLGFSTDRIAGELNRNVSSGRKVWRLFGDRKYQ